MRWRNITQAGIILLGLALMIGMAAAEDAGTPTVTATGTSTETLTGTPTETMTATPTATETPETDEADDDGAGEGLIGPGNALYGLQIAFDNIGEVFTFNASEKLGKQVSNARKRIAEARAALKRNDTAAAERALGEYQSKMKDVNDTMSRLSGKDIGLLNAQKMILKHQAILQNLSVSHPNNSGLQRAYANSRQLQEKFEAKVRQKLDVNDTKGVREVPKAEKTAEPERAGKPEKGNKN